jgi:hypothetical protein
LGGSKVASLSRFELCKQCKWVHFVRLFSVFLWRLALEVIVEEQLALRSTVSQENVCVFDALPFEPASQARPCP